MDALAAQKELKRLRHTRTPAFCLLARHSKRDHLQFAAIGVQEGAIFRSAQN